jgi:hypothetical protein
MARNRNDVSFIVSPEVLLRIFRFRGRTTPSQAPCNTIVDTPIAGWLDSLCSNRSKAGSPAAMPYR